MFKSAVVVRFRAATFGILGVSILLAGCSPVPGRNSGRAASPPRPSAPPCGSDDHLFSDSQLGWSFCYPATWRYVERDQQTTAPPGLDLTLDVVDVSTDPAEQGLFGFMIISTYERGSEPDLPGWLSANEPLETGLTMIDWGNSLAAYEAANGDRYALTPHRVIELELHSGQGNLDLQGLMGQRLPTWKFSY